MVERRGPERPLITSSEVAIAIDTAAHPRVFRANEGVDALSDSLVVGGEVLNTIHDALEKPPAPKPTTESLVLQLTGPGLLLCKSLYDVIAALMDVVRTKGIEPKPWIFLVAGLLLSGVGIWLMSSVVKAHNIALKRENPRSYDRAVRWVKWRRHEQGLDKEDVDPPTK